MSIRITNVARPWIGCLAGILIPSIIFYLYLLFNVPSVEVDIITNPMKAKSSLAKKEHIPTLNDFLEFRKKLRAQFVNNDFDKLSMTHNNTKKKCETIHVAMVCAGYNSTFTLTTVIKSVLFYRTSPIQLHLLVDEIAKKTLTVLFLTWDLPHFNVTFYKADDYMPKVSWIPNKHYSGIYGLLKLILPDVMKEDKLLVLDTDVTVLNDIIIIWRMFDEFSGEQSIGLVENQSNWYIKSLSYGQKPWPALDRGFNSGVMLMNLQKLRKQKFNEKWEATAKRVLKFIPETSLADQDVINAVIKEYPSIVFKINCTWNIQLSDHTISDTCYQDTNKINIIHWNSPRKQDVQNKNIDEFRKMHKVFLQMDGNLLRKRLFACDKAKTLSSLNLNSHENEKDPCMKFYKGATKFYRTHPFLLDYDYNVNSAVDVALTTQCSIDRMLLLEDLSKHWPGTIVVALYLTDAEVQSFLEFIKGSQELRNRRNMAYHIVYKDGELYPINYLRNVAMSYVSTPYIFQVDVDFLPQHRLYELLMNHIIKLNFNQGDKAALVIPAFETERYRFSFPNDKEELLTHLKRGILYTFRYHVWTQGHAATNYSMWRNATEPYEISWAPDFEPYIVVARSAPHYDTRFMGFGWNKVSYVTHLASLGYKFIVLPDTFIIHRPHAPSLDIGKFRSDSIYRRCLKKLKDEFMQELVDKYGNEILAKFKRTKDTILKPT